MPSKNFSHFSRHLVQTNGRFWYLRAQKVIFPQPLDLIFLLSLSKKKKKVSAKFSQKEKTKTKKTNLQKRKSPPGFLLPYRACWMVSCWQALLVQAHRDRERGIRPGHGKQCPRILGSAGILGGQLVHSSVSRKDSPFPVNFDHHRTNSFSFKEYWEADFSVDWHLKTSPLLCTYSWS